MCEKHIKIGIEGISEQISRLEATHIRDAEELIEEGVREIGSVKEAFHNSIDTYFDGVKKHYSQAVYDSLPKFYDFAGLKTRMEEVVKQMKGQLDQMRSEKMVDMASKTIRQDVQKLVSSYREQVDKVFERRLEQPQSVCFSREKLDKFNLDLESYVLYKDRTIDINNSFVKNSGEKVKYRHKEVGMEEANEYFCKKFKKHV